MKEELNPVVVGGGLKADNTAGGLLPSTGCFPVNVLFSSEDKEGTSRCNEEDKKKKKHSLT